MKNELWYQQPAAYWNEALPLGNGRMGAMVFGGIKQEHIQVNEDSVWYGKKIDRLNTDSAANIGKIQKLIFENKMEEAERLTLCALSGTPESQRQYQNLGEQQLRRNHIADHRKYFERLEIGLGEDQFQDIPTDERLSRIKEGADDYGMLELYLQFGRYLLMASSRPGSLPGNLQGIWCNEYMPIWDSKYTININTEMNYWPAESGNLSEMHEPLFKLIKKMVVNGQRTAREMYGCRGFVAHHNTDLYGDTEPQDKCITSAYIQAAGILGREIDKEKAEHILASLPKPQIGKYGQLMEWIQDYDEFEEGHRHIPHLFGLYPASQFTYEETPDLMEACEVTLRRRLKSDSGYTGWSRAWIACFWIRLRNGNEVYENLKSLLQESTFLNMMDNYPCQDERGEYKVFQIDGNLGAAAAIMDMFVQSIKDRVFLLPALPDCLKEGYVKGIIFIIHGKK